MIKSDQKDKNYWSVLDAVIRLEVSKGHLLWKVTELSRLSKVSRTLIYYYFGKSKEEIVQVALKIIGDEFFGLSEERLELWRTGQLSVSVLRTRELLRKAPYISVFYFHWRHKEGEISQQLKNLEKRCLAKVAKAFPAKTDAEIDAVFALLFGLILVPELKPQTLEVLMKAL